MWNSAQHSVVGVWDQGDDFHLDSIALQLLPWCLSVRTVYRFLETVRLVSTGESCCRDSFIEVGNRRIVLQGQLH